MCSRGDCHFFNLFIFLISIAVYDLMFFAVLTITLHTEPLVQFADLEADALPICKLFRKKRNEYTTTT